MNESPRIPPEHFLVELFRSMDLVVKLIEAHYRSPQEIIEQIKNNAQLSRPWGYIYYAYLNHDEDFEWLEKWCYNCLKSNREDES